MTDIEINVKLLSDITFKVLVNDTIIPITSLNQPLFINSYKIYVVDLKKITL